MPESEPVGRMVGRADMQTADPVLARIWNDEVKPLPSPATPCCDPAWLERVARSLQRMGSGGAVGKVGEKSVHQTAGVTVDSF